MQALHGAIAMLVTSVTGVQLHEVGGVRQTSDGGRPVDVELAALGSA